MAVLNTSPLVKTYSLEEFWELPDPPDRSKLELIAGVLYMTPPPEYTHDYVVKRLNHTHSGAGNHAVESQSVLLHPLPDQPRRFFTPLVQWPVKIASDRIVPSRFGVAQ